MCGECPDNADRNNDEQDRPDRVVRQPGESHQPGQYSQDHADYARPGRSAEQEESRQQDDDADDQVDPGPGRDIELEDPFPCDYIELAVEEAHQAAYQPPIMIIMMPAKAVQPIAQPLGCWSDIMNSPLE